MCDDDFTVFAWWQDVAGRSDDFDDDVLCGDVHAALRTFMRNKSGVPGAISVGSPAPEYLPNLLSLIIVQAFGRHERYLDANVVQTLPAERCVLRDAGQRGGVTK